MKISTNYINYLNRQTPIKRSNTNIQRINNKNNDVFIKNKISFGSLKDYEKYDIDIAKRYLCGDIDRQKIFRQQYEYEYVNSLFDVGGVDMSENRTRAILDIYTLGITELLIQASKPFCIKKANDYIDTTIEIIKEELNSIKLDEENAKIQKEKQAKKRETEFIGKINEIKEEQIQPVLLNKIQAKREGKDVEIPNCIMFSHPDYKINQELIDYCMENANAKTITISPFNDDLTEVLDNAEEGYQQSKEWNLIYVEDMDLLINRNEVDDSVVESMKALMCSIAENYHSTIIFSTTNPETLDDTAIESNRVTKINTDNLLTPKMAKKIDIETRLEDSNYIVNTPVAAINDLAEYADLNEKYLLDFYSSNSDLQKTCDKILEKLTKEQKIKYENVLKTAKENALFCTESEIKNTENVQMPVQNPVKKGGLSEIIGMDELKEDLIDEIINPLKYPEKYKAYGIDGIINGFLLYGPPGCGKTFVIKHLAEELGRYYVEITPSKVGSKYQHETVKNISQKFEEAKANAPAIVFIDEIEAIAPSRSSLGGDGSSVDINEQVTELLEQMNNCKEHDILIACASNEPQKIDNAIKRTGRLDKKIFVPPPDVKTRKALIEKQLEKIEKKDPIDIDAIAEKTEYYTAEDIRMIFFEAAKKALKENRNVSSLLIEDAIAHYNPDLSEEQVELYKIKGKL